MVGEVSGGAPVVGEAKVEVSADLNKLLQGLDKAKSNTKQFNTDAAREFLTFNNAVNAASIGLIAYSSKAKLATVSLASMGAGVATVSLGLKNMLGLLAQVGVSLATFAARNPRAATLGLGVLTGTPLLGAAAALAGTRAGGAIAGGAIAAGGFAVRHPLAALGIAGGAGLLGIAAVGAAAKAGAEGFTALKTAMDEVGKSTNDLKELLKDLKQQAKTLVTDLPKGNELTNAQLRRLGGATGGLTSPFAVQAGGEGLVSSKVIQEASKLMEELTLRFGDQAKAADQLAQALANPAKAMQVLRDAGIIFTAEQRRMLESTQTLEDRLRNAGKVVEIIRSQLPKKTEIAGFTQFMTELGKFVGGAPVSVAAAIKNVFLALGRGLADVTGLTAALKLLDQQFLGLAQSMQAVNKRFFPVDAQQELEVIRSDLNGIYQTLELLKKEAGDAGSQSFLGRLFGGGGPSMDALRQATENRRRQLENRQMELEMQEALRVTKEMEERARLLNERLQDQIQSRREELRLLQAGNRAQLEANRIGAREGVDPNDRRIRTIARLEQQIEDRRRAIAQAGQLSVFERENQQLTQQIQLFRYGNEEMETRNRLLQIELAAAQRRQPLTERQKAQLLEQLNVLKQIQNLTSTLNDAASALFNSMADALAQFATTGKFKMKEFADSVVQQLIRIALQAFVIKPLLNAISGFSNALVGGALAPGSTTSPITIPKAGNFASGGSFSVPDTGASGDRPYLIGLSAGERVDVTPANGRNGAGGGVTVVNNINSSEKFEVSTTERKGPDGRTVIEQTFQQVMKRIGRGDADGTFGARYGMRPRTAQR